MQFTLLPLAVAQKALAVAQQPLTVAQKQQLPSCFSFLNKKITINPYTSLYRRYSRKY
jgi:hypothetical protein